MTKCKKFVTLCFDIMSMQDKEKNLNSKNNTAKNSSDILTSTVASAVVSDQITLFDDSLNGEKVLNSKSLAETKLSNLKNTINENQIKLDLENLENKEIAAPINEEKQEEVKEENKKFNFLNLNTPPKTMIHASRKYKRYYW